MSKKVEGERPQKVPKTIKVFTLVKGFAVVIAIVVAFIGGWFVQKYDQGRVTAEAYQIVEQAQELKENQ